MQLASVGAKSLLLKDELLLKEYLQRCKFEWNTPWVGSWLKKIPRVNATICSYVINPAILFSFLRASEGFCETFIKSPVAKLHDETMSDVNHS